MSDLLVGGASPKSDARRHSVLHFAAKKGYAHLPPRLLLKGADVNLRDGLEQSPLYVAAIFRHASVAKILLEAGADPIIRSK